jgi:hypothetical protein
MSAPEPDGGQGSEREGKWSEVDVQLERRADLIPNLVETVKGFTKEESTVFGDIANARAGMLNAQGPQAKIAANGKLDSPWAACCCSLRTTRNCARATSSCACRTSWRGPRTASAWRASAITTRSRTTTPSCASSPTTSGQAWPDSRRTRLLQASPAARIGAHQLAQPRAIDVVHVAQVQQDVLLIPWRSGREWHRATAHCPRRE